MSPKLKKGIRWAISAAILVFLILFARTIDWHAAWSSMRHASLPLLAAAIGVNLLSILFKGVRWWLFLRPIGIKSLPLALRATLAGAGLNNVLVASGGDAARVVFVSRVSGASSSTVLASMAMERLFDPIGFVMLLVFGVLVFELPPQFEQSARGGAVGADPVGVRQVALIGQPRVQVHDAAERAGGKFPPRYSSS